MMTVWLGAMAKPLVSALPSSALNPCSKMAHPCFVEYSIRSLAPSFWGMLAKTTGAAPAGGGAAVAVAVFCRALTCTCSWLIMARSLAVVGVAAAIFAWCLVTATMFAVDRSYWKLVWMQQISWREILLGDQIPKYVGSIHSITI
jgi:hypothetical protein